MRYIMLKEKLSPYVRMQVPLVFARSGWQFAFAYRSLTPSMNNNDPGYVNYEAIIYETVEERRGRKEGRRGL